MIDVQMSTNWKRVKEVGGLCAPPRCRTCEKSVTRSRNAKAQDLQIMICSLRQCQMIVLQ
jgi:hypothetical protein